MAGVEVLLVLFPTIYQPVAGATNVAPRPPFTHLFLVLNYCVGLHRLSHIPT